MKVKLLSSIIISSLCITAFSGCSKKGEDNAHSMDLIRIDVGSEAPTLDPALSEDTSSTRIAYDLFAGLVDFDQQDNIIPGMASSWEISNEGKTYTFHLRKGLKFSDGSAITAADFVYSWRRLVDPKTASPYNMLISNIVNAKSIIDGKQPAADLGVSAPNADTFIVNLNHPDPSFIQFIHLPNTSVVSQKAIKKYGSKWTDPVNIVTSGAYVLKEHVVNGYILAEKNLNYYDAEDVHIKQVKYYPYEDKNATLPAYKSGGLEVSFQGVPIDQYAQLKQQYPKELHIIKQEASYYMDFSADNPELKRNIKLRQALSMAIDREELVSKVLRQDQTPMYSIVTATVDGGKYAKIKYDWASWPRDKQIAEAKKLYAEAGYSSAKPFDATITYNTNDLHKKVALAIAAMWKQNLGVDTSFQNQEWKTFLQTRHKGDYQIARDGWVADADSVNSYTNLYQCKGPQNNSHYCNPQFDKLIAQANLESDETKRVELNSQALQMALNDYATIPLFQYTIQVLVKPYVTNYTPEVNHLYHTQTKWMSLSK